MSMYERYEEARDDAQYYKRQKERLERSLRVTEQSLWRTEDELRQALQRNDEMRKNETLKKAIKEMADMATKKADELMDLLY